jgi:hypothetical protein
MALVSVYNYLHPSLLRLHDSKIISHCLQACQITASKVSHYTRFNGCKTIISSSNDAPNPRTDSTRSTEFIHPLISGSANKAKRSIPTGEPKPSTPRVALISYLPSTLLATITPKNRDPPITLSSNSITLSIPVFETYAGALPCHVPHAPLPLISHLS